MPTSIHTTANHTHVERAYNHMKDKYSDTINLAHLHLHPNIHTNTHIHHLYVSSLAYESKRTENNRMHSYTIIQLDCHTDAFLHAITRTHSITYIHTYMRIHTQALNNTIIRVRTSMNARKSSASTHRYIYMRTLTNTKTLTLIQAHIEHLDAHMKEKSTDTFYNAYRHCTPTFTQTHAHTPYAYKHNRTRKQTNRE
jgi:hypothetical protein